MAARVTEVQRLSAQLQETSVKVHGVQQRLRTAQAALDSAGDDVDAHVAASQEKAGCEAALRYLDTQQAELVQALQEAKKQEAKQQAAKLDAESEAILAELRHTLTGAYKTASTAADLELRASGLARRASGGPAATAENRLRHVLEGLGATFDFVNGEYQLREA